MPGVDIWMALGATIDFGAGNVKRAPKWMQKLAMEWFYRFLMEPKRMFRRYFVDDVKFFFGISAGNCLGFIVTRLKIEMKMRKLDVVNFLRGYSISTIVIMHLVGMLGFPGYGKKQRPLVVLECTSLSSARDLDYTFLTFVSL